MKDGQPIDGFTGALPEAAVAEMLARHVAAPTGNALERAEALLASGDRAGARTALDRLLRGSDATPKARLLRARVALAEGDDAGVRENVGKIDPETSEARMGAHLIAALAFRSSCGPGEAHWRARLSSSPDDLEALFGLGCCLAAAGKHREALETLFSIVARDKTWNGEAARKAMVTVFGVLGPGSDLAGEFRRRLAVVL
jgi:putative thioredoxin